MRHALTILILGTLCRAEDVQVSDSGKYPAAPPAAQTATNAPVDAAETIARLARTLGVTEIAPDRSRIGIVELDAKARTVTVPARINMRSNAIEYALVTSDGKTHESLLATDARPDQIHLACLLLGVESVPLAGDADTAQEVPLDKAIGIEVLWERDGPPVRHRLHELLRLREIGPDGAEGTTSRPRPPCNWIYTGSYFNETGFAAAQEGSIISLIRDGAALINNAAADRDRDDVHEPNTQLLPPQGAPVRVILRLP
jgi:hypothetical protein